MSRKTTFLIILIAISLLIGGLTGFYFYTKNKNVEPTILGKTTSGRSFGGYTPGNSGNSSNQNTDSLTVPNTPEKTEKEVVLLRKISAEPIAGADFVSILIYASSTLNIEPEDTSKTNGRVIQPIKPKIIGYSEMIRFIERATGHIYETATTTEKNNRISNTTIPKIYEAHFIENGKSILLRDLVGPTDVIRTRYGISSLATTTDAEETLQTTDLPTNILQLALSPSKDKVFSILKEGVTGFVSKTDGGGKQTLLNIPFNEWLVSWPENKTILLTTKPSGFYPGYAYSINPDTKIFSRVLGGISGLTTLMSPDTNRLIYSQSISGSFNLYLLDRKTKETTILSIKTLPEKCVWSNTESAVLYCAVPEQVSFNVYPDAWYQGKLSFSDSIWKVDVVSGETRELSRLREVAGEIIDVESIKISKKDDYLLFTNKVNLQLWGLNLKVPINTETIRDEVGTSTPQI